MGEWDTKNWLRAIGLSLIVLAAFVLAVWFSWSSDETTTDAFITGHIHPISARVTNTVLEVRVDDNQHVHAGDVLVTLDPQDFQVRAQLAQAQIAQSRAAMVSAAATVEHARLDLQRATELIGETPRGISRQEFDAARAAYDTALAAQDAARAQISSGNANLRDANLAVGYTNIIAPIDGYVGQKTVENGARVNAGQTLLAIVSDDVWVVANYKETQLRNIKVNAPVTIKVDAISGVTFHGHVD